MFSPEKEFHLYATQAKIAFISVLTREESFQAKIPLSYWTAISI